MAFQGLLMLCGDIRTEMVKQKIFFLTC